MPDLRKAHCFLQGQRVFLPLIVPKSGKSVGAIGYVTRFARAYTIVQVILQVRPCSPGVGEVVATDFLAAEEVLAVEAAVEGDWSVVADRCFCCSRDDLVVPLDHSLLVVPSSFGPLLLSGSRLGKK